MLSPARWLRAYRVKRSRETGKAFVAKIHDIDSVMIVDPRTYFPKVYVEGSYEKAVVKFLKRELSPGMVCIDVGANVGYYTLLMAKLVGQQGRIIAFEPTPSTARVLTKNVTLNQRSNIVVEELALFNEEGVREFQVGPSGYEVYNSLGAITHPSAVEQNFENYRVRCVTLDTYLTSSGIGTDGVDLVKIDVEGAELMVLQGMEETMRESCNLSILFEFSDWTTAGFGYQSEQIARWLLERNYHLFLLKSSRHLRKVTSEHLRSGNRPSGKMLLATSSDSLDYGE